MVINAFIIHHFAGGAFEGIVGDGVSPFGYRRGEGVDAGFGERDWICNRDRERTDTIFETLSPIDGKISGAGKRADTKAVFKATQLQYRFCLLQLRKRNYKNRSCRTRC